MKAVAPANRNTWRYGVPGGRARPVTYAARTLMARQYANQSPRLLPIDGGPLGITVRIITGPFCIFSAKAGDPMSSRLDGRGTM